MQIKSWLPILTFSSSLILLSSCGSSSGGGGGSGGGGTSAACAGVGVGGTCGGGIFGGAFSNYNLVVTPGNCTDSATPTCDGTTDTLKKQWASNAASTSNATSTSDGLTNTGTIVAHYAGLGGNSSPAANYCSSMTYGGHSDWYLPAADELAVLYTNRVAITGFDTSGTEYYWSSTETSDSSASRNTFASGTASTTSKNTNHFVRCVRQDK